MLVAASLGGYPYPASSDDVSTPDPAPALPIRRTRARQTSPLLESRALPDPMNTETRGPPLPDILKRDSGDE